MLTTVSPAAQVSSSRRIFAIILRYGSISPISTQHGVHESDLYSRSDWYRCSGAGFRLHVDLQDARLATLCANLWSVQVDENRELCAARDFGHRASTGHGADLAILPPTRQRTHCAQVEGLWQSSPHCWSCPRSRLCHCRLTHLVAAAVPHRETQPFGPAQGRTWHCVLLRCFVSTYQSRLSLAVLFTYQIS